MHVLPWSQIVPVKKGVQTEKHLGGDRIKGRGSSMQRGATDVCLFQQKEMSA